LVVQKAHSVPNVMKLFAKDLPKKVHKLNVIFALKSLNSSLIKQHVFNGQKYKYKYKSTFMQFDFSCQFPKIYIHGLVHFPVYLYLPFCTLFCGDQPKRQIHSPFKYYVIFLPRWHLTRRVTTNCNFLVALNAAEIA
jgi:hypothetical protein